MNRQDLDALTSSLYIHRSSPNPTKTRDVHKIIPTLYADLI